MVTVKLSLVRRNGVAAGAFSFDYNPGLVAEIKATKPARARWWDKALKVWFVDSHLVDELVTRLEASSGGHVIQVRRDAALGRKIAEDWRRGLGTAWPKGFGVVSAQAAGDAPGGAQAPAADPDPDQPGNAQPGASGGATRGASPACNCGWSLGSGEKSKHALGCARYLYAKKAFAWVCLCCLAPKWAPCVPLCSLRCSCEQWRRDKNQHADGCPRNPVQAPPGPRYNGWEEFFRAHHARFGNAPGPGFRFEFRAEDPSGEPPTPARRGEVATADDYARLGLAPGAPLEEVKAAHRRLAVQHHPDRGGDEEVLKAVNVAVDRIKFTIGLGL